MANYPFTYFKEITFQIEPKNNEIVLAACNSIYFLKYAKYLIYSCNNIKQDIHLHIVNPDNECLDVINFLKKELKIYLSISTEFFPTINIHTEALKSYYFCARFFIAKEIFNKFPTKKIHIVDADCLIKKLPIWDENYRLVLRYRPSYNNLWKKIMAGYVYITSDKVFFLEQVIQEIKNRYVNINFEQAILIKDKIKRSNILGIDQVCLTYILEKNKIYNESWFLNYNMISKNLKSDICYFIGDAKNDSLDKFLFENIKLD